MIAAMPEALIVDAVRTPMGRYRGALAGVRPDDLAAHGDRGGDRAQRRRPRRRRRRLHGRRQPGRRGQPRRRADGARCSRACPSRCPGVTVNRLCASGLEAVNQASRALRLGEGDLYLAGGTESMSRARGSCRSPRPACPAGRRRCTTPRSAGGWSTRGWPSATRPSRWARRPRTWPSATAIGRERPGPLRAAKPPARGRRRGGGPLRGRADPGRRRRPATGAASRSRSPPTRAPGRTPRSSGSRSCPRSSATAAP